MSRFVTGDVGSGPRAGAFTTKLNPRSALRSMPPANLPLIARAPASGLELLDVKEPVKPCWKASTGKILPSRVAAVYMSRRDAASVGRPDPVKRLGLTVHDCEHRDEVAVDLIRDGIRSQKRSEPTTSRFRPSRQGRAFDCRRSPWPRSGPGSSPRARRRPWWSQSRLPRTSWARGEPMSGRHTMRKVREVLRLNARRAPPRRQRRVGQSPRRACAGRRNRGSPRIL